MKLGTEMVEPLSGHFEDLRQNSSVPPFFHVFFWPGDLRGVNGDLVCLNGDFIGFQMIS